MKILTFRETSAIINEFKRVNKREVFDEIINSDLVYRNKVDVGFGDCVIEIFLYSDYLYIRTRVDDIDTLEPLMIQVEDDGTVVDFMLLDFVLRFKEELNLEEYYVLQSDYTFIMDRVRSFS